MVNSIRLSNPIELTNKNGFSKKKGVEAISVLKAYLSYEKTPEQVFDVQKWATFIVINRLMGGKQVLRWYNLRFYLNPKTNLLEPIGFDLGSQFKNKVE